MNPGPGSRVKPCERVAGQRSSRRAWSGNCVRRRGAARLVAMMERLRRQARRWSATCVAVMLLALVAQPVLIAASELHETAHALAAGHAHDDVHPEAGIPPDEPHEPGDAWHAVLHVGHCCSQPTAAIAAPLLVPIDRTAVPPPPATARSLSDPALPTLLRPPIAG
jgi:hypothetical protein